MTKADRKASIEELALAYAIAYDWVKQAEQQVRHATAEMGSHKINENGDFEWVRKFICFKETKRREAADFLADGLTPVSDPEDIAIINRWKRALADRKDARITFGRVKKSILALGRKEMESL